jgi:Mce-associated membrane protein
VEDPGTRTVVGALTARLGGVRGRASWRSVLAAVVVVGLVGLTGERALAWQRERALVGDGRAAVAAATAEVNGLIEVNSATSSNDIGQLVEGATAGFRDELQAQAGALRKALNQHHVTATGKVVSAGVVQLDGGRATVIVAAAGSVRNKQAQRAEPRSYRLRIDLRDDAGRWLVSGLEFVS